MSNNEDNRDLDNDESDQGNGDISNIEHQIDFPNDYNPSVGNFRPYLSQEMENIIKELKINSTRHKISNDCQEGILIAVVHCILQHHYDSKDMEHLKNFFFEFNEKLCKNPLEKEELEDLWAQLTAHLEVNRSEDITFEDWKNNLLKHYFELRKIVEENFPNLWDSLEFELAIKNILYIKDCTLPFAGILLGSPSSMKTLGIELFRNIENTFYSDNFSAKSFVSHNTSVKRTELSQIDLLPKIKNKLFLTPELSPTFAKKDEELVELLGIMIRILDGKGYESDTGAQGHRGYKGEFMFVWIGAAVEISKKVHKYLSTLGPKLYFFRIPKSQRTEDQYFEQLKGKQFQNKFSEVQNKLEEYLDWFNKLPIKVNSDQIINDNEDDDDSNNNTNHLLKIDWDNEMDEEKAIRIIIKLANLLAPLRGILTTWQTNDSQGAEYAYSLPIIEEPDRAITQLRNLARGVALTRGRNYVTMEDIPLIIKVVLSTASIERVRILDLLLNAGGQLSASQIEVSLNISKPTAKRTMAEFKGLGIVELIEGEYENSELRIRLKPKFSWFLSNEFKALREGFTPDLENEDKINLSSELKEKNPPSATDDYGNQKTYDQQKSEEKPGQNKRNYECYYCDTFTPTDNRNDYEKHVILEHDGKLAYPSIADLKKHDVKPKGKKWEI